MPLGADPLTDGELKFILQWILEGAPEHGVCLLYTSDDADE